MANQSQAWSPLRELDRFRREFDDLFDRFLGGRISPVFRGTEIGPALESFTEGDTLVVRADLPGVDPNEVEVSVTGDMLNLRGKRLEIHENKTDFLHREVSYGSFERSLKLPEGVKAEDIAASYRNGVLELRIPIPKTSAARKVPIKIATGEAGNRG